MARELDDDVTDADLDLPPLDADEDEDAPSAEDPAELVESDDEGDDGGLDDAAAGDLDVGAELDDDLDEEADGGPDEDVDVGPLDEGLDVVGERLEPGDASEREADDLGIDVGEERDLDDGGTEGTGENPEDQVDEAALPELDDGEDPRGDEILAEALLAESDDGLVPWGRVRVAVVEGSGAALPCRRVVALAGRVAAAGEVLLLVEEGALGARRLPFGEGVVAVALAEEALVAVTARGQVLVSSDFGATAAALGAYRASVAAGVELAVTPGRFWLRTGTALACGTLPQKAPVPVRERGVLAIAASGSSLFALTLAGGAPGLERFRGDDEGRMEAPLPEPARRLVEGYKGELMLAATAGGKSLALADGRTVAVSRDGGASFTLSDPGPVMALDFAGSGEDAALLGLVAREGSPSAFLVSWDAKGEVTRIGEATIVDRETQAEPEPSEKEARPRGSIVWDGAREVVWVGSPAGLVALGWPRRH
jgi:hypothetical protein